MASAIPGAVAYFIPLMASTLPTRTFIWLGNKLGVYSAPLTLEIVDIAGDQEWASIGPDLQQEETFSINCSLTSYAGDTDFQTRLAEAFAAFSLIQVAVGNDATLGGTVRLAQLRNFSFEPQADEKGQSIGVLMFEVYCERRNSALT